MIVRLLTGHYPYDSKVNKFKENFSKDEGKTLSLENYENVMTNECKEMIGWLLRVDP